MKSKIPHVPDKSKEELLAEVERQKARHGGSQAAALAETPPSVRQAGRKDGQADRRAKSSPKNGKAGGRPEVDYQQIADAFIADFEAPPRRWRGQWWRYRAGKGYQPFSQEEMEGTFSQFTVKAGIKYSKNLQGNVLAAMKKNWVEDEADMPFWLDTGESADGWVVMENGLLDLFAEARGEAGELRPHTPDLFTTSAFPFPYHRDAPAPTFDAFLQSVLNDEESRRSLLKMGGLLLVPLTRYNVFFILYGTGGSGKSTCMNIIKGVMGEKNYCSISPKLFNEKHALVELSYRLANFVDENGWPSNGKMDEVEAELKKITGGSEIWCERKGVDGTNHPATARCIFTQNPPLPQFADRDPALWDRMRIFLFPNRIRKTDDEKADLAAEILSTEREGVFARLVQGLGWLLKENPVQFPQPPDGAALMEEHRRECDKEGTFLREWYEEAEGEMVESKEVHEAYKRWCNEQGYSPKGDNRFSADVRRVFPKVEKVQSQRLGTRTMYWKGMRKLVSEEDLGE